MSVHVLRKISIGAVGKRPKNFRDRINEVHGDDNDLRVVGINTMGAQTRYRMRHESASCSAEFFVYSIELRKRTLRKCKICCPSPGMRTVALPALMPAVAK